jgi:hypothetical protein
MRHADVSGHPCSTFDQRYPQENSSIFNGFTARRFIEARCCIKFFHTLVSNLKKKKGISMIFPGCSPRTTHSLQSPFLLRFSLDIPVYVTTVRLRAISSETA